MQYTLKAPEQLKATVTLPASKSISNRALIISALSGNIVTPQNLSDCDDTNVTVRALHDMPYEIDIMASGTAMRFMTAYLSVTEGEHVRMMRYAIWGQTLIIWAKQDFPHSVSVDASWTVVRWRFPVTSVPSIFPPC